MVTPPMDEQSKKRELQKVPTRRLLASIKREMRKTMRASDAPRKPLKKK